MYTLKVEPAEFPDNLGVNCERKKLRMTPRFGAKATKDREALDKTGLEENKMKNHTWENFATLLYYICQNHFT